MDYCWDTVDRCVPPETVLHTLEKTGFESARRAVQLGIMTEYTAVRPGQDRLWELPQSPLDAN